MLSFPFLYSRNVALPLLSWSHHIVAHMWTLVVVKIHYIVYYSAGVLYVLGSVHPIQPFLFYDTIDTFCYGIVSSHNANASALQRNALLLILYLVLIHVNLLSILSKCPPDGDKHISI